MFGGCGQCDSRLLLLPWRGLVRGGAPAERACDVRDGGVSGGGGAVVGFGAMGNEGGGKAEVGGVEGEDALDVGEDERWGFGDVGVVGVGGLVLR